MASRRAFLAAASALSVAGATATAHAAPLAAIEAAPIDAGPLLAPAVPGVTLGLGWRVGSVEPVRHGAAALELLHDDGGHAKLLLCRREGAGEGLAQSDQLDFILANDGAGHRPTSETLARAVRVLAAAITADERQHGRPASLLLALQTHRRRQVELAPLKRDGALH